MVGAHGDDDAPLGSAQLQDHAVRGAAWTMIHTIVSIPIAFVVNLLLAQTLAPEGYGRLAYLTMLIAIVGSVLALGLSSAMIQFGAKAHASGRVDEVRGILSSAQGFRLLIVAPVLTLVVLILVDVPPALLLLAVVFGVLVPAALDGAPITLSIENKTASGARIAMVSNLAVQAGVVVAVLWLGTADAVWATRIIIGALGIGLALFVITPAYRRAVLRPRLPLHFPPGFWKFALPTGVAGLITELVVSRTEVLFLQWLSTPTAVGLFALAFGVSSHVFAPAQALTGPLIPAVSGLHEVGADKLVAAFSRTMRASSTVVALLVAGALPALAILVPLLYGSEFADAAPALLALGVLGGFTVSTGPLSAFVLARLSARLFLVASIAALVVDVVLALLLIPAFGLWGAVIASGAGTLTRGAVLFFSEVRALGLPTIQAFLLLAPALVGSLTCVLVWLGAGQLPLPALAQAMVAAPVAVTAAIGGLRVTKSGLTVGDREAVLRVLPALIRPFTRVLLSAVTRS